MKITNSELELIQLTQEEFRNAMSVIPCIAKIEYPFLHMDDRMWDLSAKVLFNDERKALHFYFDIHTNGEKRFVSRYIDKQKLLSINFEEECLVFVAPYISAQSAQLLSDNHCSYLDLSGNCYLLTKNLIIRNSGQPNRYIQKRGKNSYFQKSSSAASVVLRTMIDRPYATWKVNLLSEITGKALGTVFNVKNFLKEQGWIEEYPHGFGLKHIDEILQAWAKDYHQSPSHTVEYYSLDTISQIEAKVTACNIKHKTNILLAGFSAAARYAPTVRYKKVQIYVQPQELELLAQELNLKKVASGGNVVVGIPHDETVSMFARTINGDMVTSPVQTILDLLGSPSRGEEAAEAIMLKEHREDT